MAISIFGNKVDLWISNLVAVGSSSYLELPTSSSSSRQSSYLFHLLLPISILSSCSSPGFLCCLAMAGMVMVTKGGGCGGRRKDQPAADQESQLSVLAFLLAAIRKSVVSCRVDRRDDVVSAVHHLDMEIGWPTDVRHVTHVTFDRFLGFLGLPVEFQVEIPCRVPSARFSFFLPFDPRLCL